MNKIINLIKNKLTYIPYINKFIKNEQEKTLMTVDSGSLYCAKIAIHTGEGAAAKEHLKLWIPVLRNLNYEFCIITRTLTAYNQCLNNFKNLNLIYAKSPQDIENILNNLNLKIIFYLSNTGNNMHICRFRQYRHIFLGHGDSNKTASAHNGFKLYDEVWVSGQAHIDRFKNYKINMAGTLLKIIGQPQLMNIKKVEKCLNNSFLYLPTWEGTYKEQSYSSLPIAEKIYLNNNLNNIAIKEHPMTGSKNKKYKEYLNNFILNAKENNINIKHYPKNIDISFIAQEHIGFICDISAVVTTVLYFDRPIFIYIPKRIDYTQCDIPYNEFAYTFSDEIEFSDIMNKFNLEGDFLSNNRKNAIDYFISRSAMKNNKFKIYIDEILEN